MFIGMVLETLSVGLVIPALAMMTQNDWSTKHPLITQALVSMGDPSQTKMLTTGLVVLVGVYAVKSLFLGFLVWRQSRFSHDLQASLAFRLFAGYLRQPYSFHLQRNSAQLIRNIINSVNGITNVVQQCLILVTEVLVLVGIAALLLWIEPQGAITVGLVLALAAWLFHQFTRKQMERWGKASQFHEGLKIQHLQQGLGGAKDVKLLGREHDFLAQFKIHNHLSAYVAGARSTLQALPRLFLELLAVTGLATLVLIILSQGQPADAILPTVGVFAAAAFRLMPSVNRVMASLQTLRFSKTVVNTIFDELQMIDRLSPSARGIIAPLKGELRLNSLYFRYQGADRVSLDNVSLSIPCGTSVGFIGGSGAGKSTLVDVVLGLLPPDQGAVCADGIDIQEDLRGWQNQIGYVPQTIYLTDDTLRRNIAFGLSNEQIDDGAVMRAVQSAQLSDYVNGLEHGLNTLVGERGVRLSGGQRQRVGIARALYHEPTFLVLDEATSALDEDTERAVMEAIDDLHGKLTILMVAHRITTLKNCTQIVELGDGRIKRTGTYPEIVENLSLDKRP